jgi:hypothetical protein
MVMRALKLAGKAGTGTEKRGGWLASRHLRSMVTRLAVLVAAGAVVIGLHAGPAAASSSWVYNQHYGYVPTLCQSGCGTQGTALWVPNGTAVTMYCWVDAGTTAGNYASNRYFWMYISGHPGLWFVQSSYVYYQTTVKEC